MCRTNPTEFLIEYVMPFKPEDFDLKGNYSNAAGVMAQRQERRRISVCATCREDTDFDELFGNS
jgi:hypothetical protein